MYKTHNLEEFKMGIPKKRKNDLKIYSEKELLPRRQELLDLITKSDTYLPDSILHDDLDRGMLDYVEKNFVVISEEKQIPIIPRILTIQRWGEIQNTWEFVDEDRNITLPFVSIVRRPDVQPGTNPSVQRTIPDRHRFHYATVKTWNGGQMGADVYKIPQPIAVDITYEVSIICTKFRDLNRFNKIVMERFCSRQDYTTIKGHYVPIVLDSIEDNTPMETVDGRRFYSQNYKFTMLGFLIDSEEFEVKPAINRVLLLTEFVDVKDFVKSYIDKTIRITVATFTADGVQTVFSVGETISMLFTVAVNGLVQELGVDYYFIQGTSKITFATAPIADSIITITYYKGKNSFITDTQGRPIQLKNESFVYSNSLTFTLSNVIDSVVTVEINGLVEDEGVGYAISSSNQITLLSTPVNGSRIGVTYLY
jgi:hypothetical protein